MPRGKDIIIGVLINSNVPACIPCLPIQSFNLQNTLSVGSSGLYVQEDRKTIRSAANLKDLLVVKRVMMRHISRSRHVESHTSSAWNSHR